jgi:allantoinase
MTIAQRWWRLFAIATMKLSPMVALTPNARAACQKLRNRRLIKETTEVITHHESQPPAGWLGPWIAQSHVTPDLLQESGYTYLLDWCHDDQPIWFQTRNGRILSVPYPQEVNDIPAIVARKVSAADFADMIVDNFDEMLEQSTRQPLVYGIALHPYIVGQPFRLRHLRRALQQIIAETEFGTQGP